MKLELRDVSFGYGNGFVLENITLSVEEGNVVGIVGPNASGKTTLLKCVNMILKPRGHVLLDGTDLRKLKSNDLAKIIGYVPQETLRFFPTTVFDLVLLGRKPHLNWSPTSKDLQVVSSVISLLGLDDLMLKNFSELSGGERQKGLIGRALAQKPRILLLDEPTSHLDINHQLEVLKLVRELAKKAGLIVILVSHDLNLVNRYCDKLVLLSLGRIYSMGPPKHVLTPENIKKAYNVDVEITYHQKTKCYNIIPIS